MRIYFDYPLATEENIKAVQDAIEEGKDIGELLEIFDGEMLWDCVVVLSGYQDKTWSILFNLDGPEQIYIEDWQSEFIEEFISEQQNQKN